jgi:hypothetical protein
VISHNGEVWSMGEEIRIVLNLLAEKKITVEEAE